MQARAQFGALGLGQRELVWGSRPQLVEAGAGCTDLVGTAAAVDQLGLPCEEFLRLAANRDLVGQGGVGERAPCAAQLGVANRQVCQTRIRTRADRLS
jgi:hypothetical protein